MRAMESTRKKLEASEEKEVLKTSAPKVMTSSEAPYQKQILSEVLKIIRSWRSSEAERIVASKANQRIQSRLTLQKTRRLKQRLIQMELKSLDAYSLERVEKRQLYEVYNHYLHSSVLSLQQDKNNSYTCTNVPPDLEWIWNWSFIRQ